MKSIHIIEVSAPYCTLRLPFGAKIIRGNTNGFTHILSVLGDDGGSMYDTYLLICTPQFKIPDSATHIISYESHHLTENGLKEELWNVFQVDLNDYNNMVNNKSTNDNNVPQKKVDNKPENINIIITGNLTIGISKLLLEMEKLFMNYGYNVNEDYFDVKTQSHKIVIRCFDQIYQNHADKHKKIMAKKKYKCSSCQDTGYQMRGGRSDGGVPLKPRKYLCPKGCETSEIFLENVEAAIQGRNDQ